eukprot:4161866-Pleurochrysis_carterae.AAC.1
MAALNTHAQTGYKKSARQTQLTRTLHDLPGQRPLNMHKLTISTSRRKVTFKHRTTTIAP